VELAERAQVRLVEAGVLSRSGDNDRCLELAARALWDAERIDDAPTTALALERIQLAMAFLHQSDTERTGQRALEIQLGRYDLHAAARVQINLGIAAYFESRWSEAAEWYMAAVETSERSGNVVMAANGAINSAEILADQGAWQRALDLLDGAVRNFEAMRYAPGIGASLLFSAVPAMRAGLLDAASERLARSRSIFESLGMNELLADLRVREFELELLRGHYDESAWLLAEAELGARGPTRHRLLRVHGLGCYLTNTGDATQALSEARSTDAPTDFELALTLLASTMVDPEHSEADDWRRRNEEIRTQLGIERFPQLVAEAATATSR